MEQLDYDYLAKLVKKTQDGDSNAFAELYAATYQKEYRFAYQYVKDPYLAQDILQDLYIIVLKNIQTLKNPRLFISWLQQICFRLCFDAAKKQQKHAEELVYEDIRKLDVLEYASSSTPPQKNPEHHVLLQEEQTTIMEKVLSLPPQYAQVIIMRFYSNMGLDEISRAMDCSRSTTKRRLKKAEQLLEELLNGQKGGMLFA